MITGNQLQYLSNHKVICNGAFINTVKYGCGLYLLAIFTVFIPLFIHKAC